MSEPQVTDVKQTQSLAKGLLAGFIAGLAATAAKSLAERIFHPSPKQEPEPHESASQHSMSKTHAALAKARQSEAFHWGLSAATGATYGAIAEFYPEATSRHGASFGLALQALTHEGALPALDLAAETEIHADRQQGSQITSYLIYGVTTELVRKLVRRWL